MNKMLVTDYDRTFYINDDDIEINKKYVNKFIENKNIFVIATGRSYFDFHNKLEIYKFNYEYVILNHGATIIDKNNKVLLNISMLDEIIPKIKEDLELGKSIKSFCCSEKESRVDFEHKDLTKIHVKYNTKEEAMEKVDLINKKYGKYVNAYYITNSLEIISKETNKALAIYEVMKLSNISKENVFTIGDSYTDIQMVKEFNGYCMKNSVEELKKYSKDKYNSVSELISKIM